MNYNFIKSAKFRKPGTMNIYATVHAWTVVLSSQWVLRPCICTGITFTLLASALLQTDPVSSEVSPSSVPINSHHYLLPHIENRNHPYIFSVFKYKHYTLRYVFTMLSFQLHGKPGPSSYARPNSPIMLFLNPFHIL